MSTLLFMITRPVVYSKTNDTKFAAICQRAHFVYADANGAPSSLSRYVARSPITCISREHAGLISPSLNSSTDHVGV